MSQGKPSISATIQGPRRRGSGRSSPHNRHSSAASSVSSQESDSSSEYGTPLSTPSASRPGTRIPTPSVKSDKGRAYMFYSISSPVSDTAIITPYNDGEAGPSGGGATAKDRGKEPEVYEDSEPPESIATRLSRMENKLDLLLPLLNEILNREKQPSYEETLRMVTKEQLQSSQIYRDLEAKNESLKEEVETVQKQLAASQRAHGLAQRSIQDLEAAKERSESEVNEWKAQAMKKYDTMRDNYLWAEENWNRTTVECKEAWDEAKKYETENTTLKQRISDLEDVNKELAEKIEAHELEYVRREEAKTDRSSQTEPEGAPKIMESRGTETSFIEWDPNTMGEMQLLGQGKLESAGIQNSEQVQQENRQEDEQQRLQMVLQHDQHETPQDEHEEKQKDEPQEEPAVQPDSREPYEGQYQGQQEEAVEKPQEGQEEIEQDRQEETKSLDRKIARGKEQLKELMSTAQDLATGRHTEPESPEQQDIVETAIGNDQPTFESSAERSPPENQDVAVIDTAPKPEPVNSPDPAPISSTERRPKRDRYRHGKHRHRRLEDRDHERNRVHRRDRDERQDHRPNHRNDRPRDTEHRIQRRQQQGPAPYWTGSPSWMKTYFGTGLRDLIRSLKIRIRG